VQVVSYGISINLVEVTWKSKIKAQFPNPNDYSSFMGNFSTATGTVTFLMMLLSRVIFRKFGWGTAALITPTVLLITGACPLPVDASVRNHRSQEFLRGHSIRFLSAYAVLPLLLAASQNLWDSSITKTRLHAAAVCAWLVFQHTCPLTCEGCFNTARGRLQACCSSRWCCSADRWTRCWRPSA
jgi:hypothetical protein